MERLRAYSYYYFAPLMYVNGMDEILVTFLRVLTNFIYFIYLSRKSGVTASSSHNKTMTTQKKDEKKLKS